MKTERVHSHGEQDKELGIGPAITYLYEDAEGRFVVGNGEYESQVAYCPWCGARAPTSPDPEEEAYVADLGSPTERKPHDD